jgi:outer membrane immunogenic protein
VEIYKLAVLRIEVSMIKKALFSTTMVLTLSTGWAVTAQNQNYILPPSSAWTGFYAGLNAGGIWNANTKLSISSSFIPGSEQPVLPNGTTYLGRQSALASSGDIPTNSRGFIGGGQLGYNRQFKDHVIGGVEADFQGIASGHNNGQTLSIAPLTGTYIDSNPAGTAILAFSPGEFVESSLSGGKRINYLGSLRGQLGWLATPTLLLSGTGGLAYGGVSSWTSITQTFQTSPSSTTSFISPSYIVHNDTLFGWTIGANTEWMFIPNWSIRCEYLYYDLGSVHYSLAPTIVSTFFTPSIPPFPQGETPIAAVASQAATRFNGNILRMGVSYHFT